MGKKDTAGIRGEGICSAFIIGCIHSTTIEHLLFVRICGTCKDERSMIVLPPLKHAGYMEESQSCTEPREV